MPGLGGALAALLALSACAVEMGPPPESDPPLVPQKAKTLPPPPQPSEPQAWSRDLDLDDGPTRIDAEEVSEGLVAQDSGISYSGERLTYESAFDPERPPTEAELTLQRARERAAAAGRPAPPAVTPAPVAQVSEQSLPPISETAAAATPRRESRLPPPPKFPPLKAKGETAKREAAEDATTEAAESPPPQQAALPASEAPIGEPPEPAMAAEGGKAPPPSPVPFAAEAWDAPAGTILVQVSAVQSDDKVVGEWQRLRARYPQVLEPLRLVVEEAKLGDRGVFYRVQAGAFSSREGATAACDKLIGAGQSCFVVVR